MFSTQSKPAPLDELGKRTKHLSLAKYSAKVGFLFILPWLVGFVLLKLLPILAALAFSFTDFNMLQPEAIRFVGLSNYAYALRDTSAGASLFGSISYFVLAVPIEMLVALVLAVVFCSEGLRGKRILRTLFFMPSIIPAIAIFFVVNGLATPGSGWIDRLIMQPLNLPPLAGLYSLFPVILAVWSIGPGFLIMLGAMQSVPKEVYEAARVDGAGPITRFFSITMPMISPAVFFSLVINTISSFGGVALLDRGLPYSQSLSPMESYINQVMFSGSELGYASALAWIMFIVVMIITVAMFRSARYWVHFPEEDENVEI